MKEIEVFSSQVRGARGLLGWSQSFLAELSGVSRTVIARLELGTTDARSSTIDAIRTTLGRGGIDFVVQKDGSYGVLIRAGIEPFVVTHEKNRGVDDG